MKRLQRNLLAVALTAALASPLAFAQSVTGQVTGTVQGTTQLPTSAVEHTVEHATDATMDVAQDTTSTVDHTVEHGTDTAMDAAHDTKSAVDSTVQDTDANAAADAQVKGQADIKQEEGVAAGQGFAPPAVWATLDANADGHIDAREASADAGFQANFDAIDTNNDGVVSKAEFRVERKDEPDDRQK